MNREEWVRAVWAGQGGWAGVLARGVLLPAEGLFRAGVWWRNRRYDAGALPAARAPVPVISVGNLSVGGTGKTPLSGWLVGELAARGHSPALVARGYGSDELRLHERWNPSAPVVAHGRRIVAAREAAERGCDVVVLDDGFQHRRLARTLDLVLVSAEQGLPGPLLPRGPFREPRSALRRAHGVIVTRKSAPAARAEEITAQVREAAPEAVVSRVHLAPGALEPLGAGRPGGEAPGATGTEAGVPPAPSGPVVVATGVAQPGTVRAALEAQGSLVEEARDFPDHYEFTEADATALAEWARGRPLVVTEKDAVKLERFDCLTRGEVFVLKQDIRWEEGREALERLVRAAAGERP